MFWRRSPPSPVNRLQLPAGMQAPLLLRAGSVVHVHTGCLRLIPPPQWLEHGCVSAPLELRPGCVRHIPRSGYWQLQAGARNVEVSCMGPQQSAVAPATDAATAVVVPQVGEGAMPPNAGQHARPLRPDDETANPAWPSTHCPVGPA